MFSCHSHSGQYCMHAHGTLEQVVEQAIALGFTNYALTEHMPRTRSEDLYPEEAHLAPKDTLTMYSNFYKEARHLQANTRKLRLLVGMETEWIHENTGKELTDLLKEFPVDFLVGSVHHVDGIPIDFDVATFEKAERKFGLDMLMEKYFDAQYDMLEKIKPLVVGHFDLIRMYRPNFELTDGILSKIKRNVQFIKDYGGLIEINSRAFKKGLKSAYPFPDVLNIMKEYGCRFTLSDDAHGPRDVGMHYDLLREYLKQQQIKIVHVPEMNDDQIIQIKAINLSDI